MAIVAKKVEASKATSDRAKKGDGPISLVYIDAEGNVAKRVSEKTVGVRVSDKFDNVKDFMVSELPPVIRHQLVVLALGKRIDTYVRNSVEENGSNAIELAALTYDNIKGGTIYSRKESAGTSGRPFDFEFWKSIIVMTAAEKKVPVSEKQIEQFMTKMRAMTSAERKDWITRSKMDKIFAYCWKRAELAKAKESLKKGGAASEVNALDMF